MSLTVTATIPASAVPYVPATPESAFLRSSPVGTTASGHRSGSAAPSPAHTRTGAAAGAALAARSESAAVGPASPAKAAAATANTQPSSLQPALETAFYQALVNLAAIATTYPMFDEAGGKLNADLLSFKIHKWILGVLSAYSNDHTLHGEDLRLDLLNHLNELLSFMIEILYNTPLVTPMVDSKGRCWDKKVYDEFVSLAKLAIQSPEAMKRLRDRKINLVNEAGQLLSPIDKEPLILVPHYLAQALLDLIWSLPLEVFLVPGESEAKEASSTALVVPRRAEDGMTEDEFIKLWMLFLTGPMINSTHNKKDFTAGNEIATAKFREEAAKLRADTERLAAQARQQLKDHKALMLAQVATVKRESAGREAALRTRYDAEENRLRGIVETDRVRLGAAQTTISSLQSQVGNAWAAVHAANAAAAATSARVEHIHHYHSSKSRCILQ